MKSSRLVAFMLVACGFSWSLWLPAIASSRGWIPFRFSPGPLGSFGPAVAALVLAWLYGEKGELRSRLRALVTFGSSWSWLLWAVTAPAVVTALAVLAHAVVVGGLPNPDYAKLAYTPAAFVLILFLGGPLGEEPGWRGYVLPRVRARYAPVASGLVVAGLWLVWHLPLFWLEGAAQEGSSIALFAVTVTAISLAFTWLYGETAPSLVAVVLFHTSINTISFGMPYVLPGVDESMPYSITFVIGYVMLAVLAAVKSGRARVAA